MVFPASVCCTAAELNSPKLVDNDRLATRVLDGPHKLSGQGIVCVDRPGVGVVRDQQSVTQRSKVRRSHRNTPGLIEPATLDESFQERSILVESIDETTPPAARIGKGNVDHAVDVLDAEGGEASRKAAIGKRSDEVEGPVVNIDFVVYDIGGKKEIAGSLIADREAGVDGSRCRVVHLNMCLIEIGLRSPSTDGSVQSCEQKEGRPSLDLEVRGSVKDNSGGRTRAVYSRRNQYSETLGLAGTVIERRPTRAIICDPKRTARAVGEPPRIHYERIGMFCCTYLIRH